MKKLYPYASIICGLVIGCALLAGINTEAKIPVVTDIAGKQKQTAANLNDKNLSKAIQKVPDNIDMSAGKCLAFIENKGQMNDQYGHPRNDIQYGMAAAKGLTIFIGNGAIHYQFSKAINAINATATTKHKADLFHSPRYINR